MVLYERFRLGVQVADLPDHGAVVHVGMNVLHQVDCAAGILKDRLERGERLAGRVVGGRGGGLEFPDGAGLEILDLAEPLRAAPLDQALLLGAGDVRDQVAGARLLARAQVDDRVPCANQQVQFSRAIHGVPFSGEASVRFLQQGEGLPDAPPDGLDARPPAQRPARGLELRRQFHRAAVAGHACRPRPSCR